MGVNIQMGVKKKEFLLTFLLMGVFLLFFSGVNSVAAAGASNTTIYVSTSGNDAWNGLSATYSSSTGNGPKKSINAAVTVVAEDGTIHVAQGTYDNNGISIDTSMTIIGANQQNTIISGSKTGTIFDIKPGVYVNLTKLTLSQGQNTYGGAINNDGTLTIDSCTFTNNAATSIGGGAIYNEYDGNLIVNDSSLTNNQADSVGEGGAIYNDHGILSINDTTLENNNAEYGGAIYTVGTASITNSIFDDNNAGDNGGAIMNDKTLTMDDCTLNNNGATDGGAVYNDGNLELSDSTLNTNTASNNGGAINNYWGILTINNDLFNFNTGYDGGAIYNDNRFTVMYSTFNSNTANDNGGAIYADVNTDPNNPPVINYSQITGNSPTNSAIYSEVTGVNATLNWWGSDSNPSGYVNSNVDVSDWMDSSGSEYVYVSPSGDDTGGDGSQDNPFQTIAKGVSYVYPGGTVYVASGTYDENSIYVDTSMTITGSSEQSTIINGDNTGTIFYVGSGVNLVINNATLTDGQSYNGGAIYNDGTVTINNCTLDYNTATNNGGAIYNDVNGMATITGCSLTNNYAVDGGAIYNNNNLDISNSQIINNHASNNGGAVYNDVDTSSSAINFNQIIGNNPTNSEIYSVKPSKTDATCNWWGSNNNPSNYVNSNVSVDPWLVLTLTPTNDVILNNGTTDITADLYYDNQGNYYDPSVYGSVPNGTPVTFTETLGSLNPTSAVLTNGQASSIFTAKNLGISSITATMNSQTVNTQINIIQPKSIVYVSPTGSDTTGDGSQSNPFQTITTGVFCVSSGGTVYIGTGTYNENGININGNMTLIGADQQNTIVNGNFNGDIFNIAPGSNVSIDNLTLIQGSNDNGGAIDNNGVLTMTNTTLNYNSGVYGGAIYNEPDGTLTITNGTFDYNSGAFGGAIFNYGNLIITNSSLNNNGVNGEGGAIYNDNNLEITGSAICNNTAVTDGGAIFNDEGANSCVANFNQIVNNSANEISSANSGTTDATLNWWGSNSDPSVNIAGNVNVSTWLVLTVNASTTGLPVGGYSTITADLTHDQNGGYHDPTNGHVPDGIPVNFTGNLGALTPESTVLNKGTASSTFNAGNLPGTALINATVDNQVVNTSINIYNEANLNITNTASSSPLNVGQTGTFTLNVTNNGPDTATNIKITDALPTGFTAGTPTQGTYNSTTGIWTITSLTSGQTATLTFTGLITSNMAGTNITNNANATWTEYPGTVTIPQATIYIKEANVAITQTGNYSGNTVTFIVTATNNGPDTATNIVISDPIPLRLSNAHVTPSIGTYSNGVWTINSLLNGTFATLNITGTAVPQSIITNNATRTTQTEYNNEPNTIKLSMYVPDVNIAIYNYPWWYNGDTQSQQYTYVVGNAPVLTTDIWNNGPDDATGVVIEYDMGSGLEYQGCSADIGTVTYNSQNNSLTWDLGNIPNGGDVLLKIFVRITQSGTATPNLTTTSKLIHVDQYDSDTTDNTATCALTAPTAADIQVNQTQNTYTGTNGKKYITYTITTTNNGPDTATGVQITDLLPTGTTYSSSTIPTGTTYNPTTGIWNIGTLNNTNNLTLTITAQITATTGTITNTASESNENEYDPNYANNAQTCSYTISGTYTPTSNIAIYNYPWWYNSDTQSQQYTYVVGNAPVLTTDIWNNGPDDATGVVIEYDMGSGLEYEGCSADIGTVTYNSQNNSLTWDLENIPNGGDVLLKIFVRITQSGTATPNLTTTSKLIHVDQYDSDTTDNTATCALTAPTAADIQVNQTQNTTTDNNGNQYVTYTITVTNNGPDTATGVQITNLLPTGTAYNSSTIPTGTTYNPTTGIWNIGTLNNTNNLTLTITAQITATTGTITNTASESNENEYDPNYANNAQTQTLTLQ